MSEQRAAGLLSWVPGGLLTAATLAVGRTLGLIAASERGLVDVDSGQREILRWEHVGSLPDQMVAGLVLGLVSAAMLNNALRARGGWMAVLGPFLFVLALLLMGLTGWPLDPPALRAELLGTFAFDDLVTNAGFALLLGLFLLGSLVGAQRGHGYLVAGPFGLVLGVAALVVPLFIAWQRSERVPTFTRREAVRELLADPTAWEVLEAPEGRPPYVDVITPAVENKTDSADKPALILSPFTRVRFRVRPEDGPVRLRAAAGVHQKLRVWLQKAGHKLAHVDFRVSVNDEPIFAARVPVQDTWYFTEYIDGAFVWHHVGGDEGLALQPGDEVTLETSVPAEDPAALAPPEFLMAGFGPLVLERERSLPRAQARVDAPNIIYVVMDTQRADRLSCYGHTRRTTPHLDGLAERGVLFENAYSAASWTWPSTASLLTGLPCIAHGVVSNASCTLNLPLDTLGEVLQERGYTSAAFSCNPLIAAERNFDQGFEFFDHDRNEFRMSDEVMPDIQAWLRAHRGVRFFLYLHLADPHTPHRPHPEEVERLGFVAPEDFPEPNEHGDGMDQYNKLLRRPGSQSYRDLIPAAHRRWIDEQYDASVATGDRWLGVLFQELRALGLEETTVVAFTSDHGEELFDHDMLEHGHTLYRELVHVPLILAGPGIPRGMRVPGVLANRHLAPTLARLGGAELPDCEEFQELFLLDGKLTPRPDETGQPRGEAVYQTYKGDWNQDRNQRLYGLRDGEYVLHWRPAQGEKFPEEVRLYHLPSDPGETRDCSATEPVLVQQLLERLKANIAAQEKWAPDFVVGAGDSTTSTLIGIGYVPGEDEDEAGDEER